MTDPAGSAEPVRDSTSIVDSSVAADEVLPNEPSPTDREMQDAADVATEFESRATD